LSYEALYPMNTTMMPDQSAARALLRRIGMDVPEKRIAPVFGGTINTTFRIDNGDEGPLILRIAPSDAEVEAGPSWMTSHGLQREQVTIGLLSSVDHLLPRTVGFDDSRQYIDRDWVLQTSVRGQQWQEARKSLTAAEEQDLWRELGGVTRQIHAVTGEEFGPPLTGLGCATWSDLVRWDVAGFSVDAHRYGLEQEPFEQLQGLVDDAAPVLNEITEPRLVHSDLNERHIFIAPGTDGRPHITGLIDFEFARFADPYSETIFIDEALLPSNDGRNVALCQGYECDKPTHDDMVRQHIYILIAMGWTVMDLVRRDQPKQVPALLERMQVMTREAWEM
jgi:aminoglycoside phosphotransferase (APT) family kinase protein